MTAARCERARLSEQPPNADAGRTGKADRTRPEGQSAYHIRFIFAHSNQDEKGAPLSLLGAQRYSELATQEAHRYWQIGDAACDRRTARFACRVAAI